MMNHQEYKISGVSVLFPCKPYPSQFSMMDKILKGIERRQNCLLESPTGSGKSLALLCSALAWQATEKAKKELEEMQDIERAQCTCPCHKEENISFSEQPSAKSSPVCVAEKTSNDKTDDNKSEKSINLNPSADSDVLCCKDDADDEDDFKMDGKNLNLPNNKKGARNHIKISYEDEKPEAKPKVDCKLCDCEANNPSERQKTKIPKIFFGTRTHKQVAQIAKELRRTAYGDVKMTILGSREHTCIHPQVSKMKNKNDGCKDLLNDQGGCRFKDATPRLSSHKVIKEQGLNQAWDLEDLVSLCKAKKACPYFLCRSLKDDADIVICPYNYLVDPLIREALLINLKGNIVILDEAHNIEDSARDAASQSIGQDDIFKGMRDIDDLIEQGINFADHSKLRSMLRNLDSFIEENKGRLEQRDFDKSYKIWSGFYIVAQLENIGLGPKFYPELKKALTTIKMEQEQRKEEAIEAGLNEDTVKMKPATENLLDQIFQVLEYLYRADLKFVDDYRASLVQSYHYVPRTEQGQWLNSRNRYGGRNMVQTELYTLNFWCMNPGVAFSDFAESRSIILTSGTLSPLTSFESELGLDFKIQLEANHVIKDSQVWVGTLGEGPTGGNLQAVFRNLETFTFQDELGSLVLRVCQTVPHGILCFLPSYKVLEKLITRWESTGVMQKIARKKRIISEPRGSDKLDFEEQMKSFYDAVSHKAEEGTNSDNIDDSGIDGAVFFAVCRGKVSEGLDFADNFARAVITVGIPYPNFKDVQVELKRKYNDQHRVSRGLLSGSEWYEIQAFRALNQALGRCIRHRQDWGALIIVDERFVKSPAKYCKGLSKWVRSKIQNYHNFACAMDSLSLFTQNMLEAQKKDPTLGTTVLGRTPSPRKPLGNVNTPATPAFKNFPIFSLAQTPLRGPKNNNKLVNSGHSGNGNNARDKQPYPNKNLNSSGNKTHSLATPSSKLAEKIKGHQYKNSQGTITDSPMVDGPLLASTVPSCLATSSRPNNEDQSIPATALSTSRSHVTTVDSIDTSQHLSDTLKASRSTADPALTTAVMSSDATKQKTCAATTTSVSVPPVPVPSGKVQLHIITDQAAAGVRFQVFNLPQELRQVFGGDISLPVSTTEKLEYLVDPPTGPGLNPTARLFRKSSDTKMLENGEQATEMKAAIDGTVTEKQETSLSTSESKLGLSYKGPPVQPEIRNPASSKLVPGPAADVQKTRESLLSSSSSALAIVSTSSSVTQSIPSTKQTCGTLSSGTQSAPAVTSFLASALSKVRHPLSASTSIQPVGAHCPLRPILLQMPGDGNPSMYFVPIQQRLGAPPILLQAPGQIQQQPSLVLATPNGSLPLPRHSLQAPTKGSSGQGFIPAALQALAPPQQAAPELPVSSSKARTSNLSNAISPPDDVIVVEDDSNANCPLKGRSKLDSILTFTTSTAIVMSQSPVLFSPSPHPHITSQAGNTAVSPAVQTINKNKKPLFKQKSSPTLEANLHNSKHMNMMIHNESTAASLVAVQQKNVRKTPSKSSFSPDEVKLNVADNEGLGEDDVDSSQVKRKVRGRKRSTSARGKKSAAKRSKEENDSALLTPKLSIKMSTSTSLFKCNRCGHILVKNKSNSEIQNQRTTPPFLREAIPDKTGCYFLNTNTMRVGLQTLPEAVHGSNTKYVEQEEICIQFLYCCQCIKSNPQQVEAVAAQVQLAAGSGARFSKGQMWLFYHHSNQEMEN